jgi:hypothetical protein
MRNDEKIVVKTLTTCLTSEYNIDIIISIKEYRYENIDSRMREMETRA